MVVRCGGSWAVQGEYAPVKYALPERATAELKVFFSRSATVDYPAPFVGRLPGGRVFGSGHVLAPDGSSIARDVSPDLGKPFEEHWLLTYQKIPPPVPMAGYTAVIAVPLGAGYSHWLLEELPRLLAIGRDEADAIIAQAGHSFHRDALALHGFKGKVVPAKRFAHLRCEQLIVPSLGQLNPATVSRIDEFAAPLRNSAGTWGERIYISREQARRRRVLNEEELWTQLAARGFVKVHLEALTWREQINAFRGAQVVVAPHGAGLANLVFCRPGTRVVELFRRDYVNGCYWQLAALKELEYSAMVPAGDEPLAQRLSANRRDIQADVAAVVEAIR